jgi:hypothetical protein
VPSLHSKNWHFLLNDLQPRRVLQALEVLAKLLLEREVVERLQLQAIFKSANGLGGDSERRHNLHEQSQFAEDYKA